MEMDITLLTSFLLISIQLLVIKCDNLDVKKLWDDTNRICGHTRIEDLSKSLRAELQNQSNITSTKNWKRKDRIVVTYNDFRCCLKKTNVKNLMTGDKEIECMENLLQCLVISNGNNCKLGFEDYVVLAFSRTSVLACSIAASYGILISFFVLYHIHIGPNDRRAGRRRLENP